MNIADIKLIDIQNALRLLSYVCKHNELVFVSGDIVTYKGSIYRTQDLAAVLHAEYLKATPKEKI